MNCPRCGKRIRFGLTASENPRYVHIDTGLTRCWGEESFKTAQDIHLDAENKRGN